VRRDEGVAMQVHGVEPARMDRSGPTVAWFAHALVVTPYCPPGNSDRSDATLSGAQSSW
jgi:hypothetical protein